MEFLLYPLVLGLTLPQMALGFSYIICSTKGGPCKLEDIQQLVHNFLDDTSNYLYSAYLTYCRHVCLIAHQIFETWNKYTSTSYKSTSWYRELWELYVTPLAIRMGLQRKKEEYIEDYVCKSSTPGLAILCSLSFCILVFYLSRKPKRKDSKSKLDISAYINETEEDEMQTNSTLSTLINNYDQRSCCGCKATISDVSERSGSAV